jgi:hypothetical protein
MLALYTCMRAVKSPAVFGGRAILVVCLVAAFAGCGQETQNRSRTANEMPCERQGAVGGRCTSVQEMTPAAETQTTTTRTRSELRRESFPAREASPTPRPVVDTPRSSPPPRSPSPVPRPR